MPFCNTILDSTFFHDFRARVHLGNPSKGAMTMGLRIILFLCILVIILAATLIHIGCQEEEEDGGGDDDGGGGSKSACCLESGGCVMVHNDNSYTSCFVENYNDNGGYDEVFLKGEKCSSNPCGYTGDDDSYDDDDSSTIDEWYKYLQCIDDCKDDCGACCTACGLGWSGNGWCEVPGSYTGSCHIDCHDDFDDCFDWCVYMYN